MEKQWISTNYYTENPGKSPFIEGEYYHIGFKSFYNESVFNYQGVLQYTLDGFIDYDGLNIKPFPTHYIYIEKPTNKPL